MATTAELVARLYIAYFNRAPDPAGLQHWVDDLNAGGSLLQAANDFAGSTEAAEVYPYIKFPDTGLSPNDFINQVYLNVLARPADADGLAYYAGKLAAGESAGSVVLDIINNAVSNPNNDDALRLQNKVDVGLYWAQKAASNLDLTYADADGHLTPGAMASAHGVIDGVNNTAGSVTEGEGEADAFFATGKTFILTPDADLGLLPGQDFYGTEHNDTYIAGTVNSGIFSGNTLGTGDAFDGKGGTDLLQILDDGTSVLTPHIKNIEKVSVQALGGVGNTEVVMTNAAGVEEIINDRSVANVTFEDIQNATAISVVGSNATLIANYAAGADFGDDLKINVNGAGVVGDRANIYVSTDDTPTALSIDSSGKASFVTVDVDDSPGPGTTVQFETLNITGNADLNLRDNGGEFNHVTTVNVNSTGGVNLDLINDNEDVAYNGANGSGDDVLRFGNGNNTIDTGAGNDKVDVSGTGNNTVNLGDGDDEVIFGTNATAADKADGGAGIDTISIDVHTLTGLTANSTFEGSIQNFEKVHATGQVAQGGAETIDLANLDDINYVITDGTQAGVKEVQTFNVNSGAYTAGGEVVVGGVRVAVDQTSSSSNLAQQIVDHAADIIAANPTIESIGRSGNQVQITYKGDAGNVAPLAQPADNPSGVTFNTFTNASGTAGNGEVQQLAITAGTGTTGIITVQVKGVPVNVTVTSGLSAGQTASAIAAAINQAQIPGVTSASVQGGTNVRIAFNYDQGNVAAPSFNAGGTGAAATLTDNFTAYSAGTPEVQTFKIGNGTDGNGGEVYVFGARIPLDAGLTVDQVGVALVSHLADIKAASPNIADISYNTANQTVTVTYTPTSGNVTNASPSNVFDNGSGVNFGTVNTQTQGSASGIVTLNNLHSGGTLELNGANNGITIVNLATQTANDSFNIVLDKGIGNNDGSVKLAGIETLNVTQQNATATHLGLDASDTATVVVTGKGGVDFIAPFAKLTSFDASGVTGTGADGAVHVVTNADANTSLTGGAGNDTLWGSDHAARVDTINGGAGNDTIVGRAGADVLTGGAGNDTFVYQNVADSQGTTIDTITDFTSGQDKLDFSAITGGVGSYTGAADGYGAVLTALTSTAGQAVLDSSTSTLYVDVNGDGQLTNADLAIHLTGVTALSNATDFTW